MKIAVMGAAGRMGRELVRAIAAEPGAALSGGIERSSAPEIGADLGQLAGLPDLGVKVTSDPLDLIARSDAIIDFTSPKATIEFAGLAANARIVHVIGTTGFDPAGEEAIRAAARHATIIKSGNMSFGVNLLAALTRKIAAALDPDFDIEILEMHHRMKVDAPSGTALLLGKAAAEGRGVAIDDASVRTRDGHTGARRRGDIGFATLRGGSVVGDHTVMFAGPGEIISLTHHAADRSIFSKGAVKAALWGRGKPPGLYSMIDVLGL
ncbi:MAG: 4-hydroxy-tetrahydrodipicolinate reductase [Hyphomicrobium sp.]|nr:4-hydroxy-tetrahydrodipicolinate reductase [Hyphomicrobium sp.]